MKNPGAWNKLADLARRAPDEPEADLALSFVTRVAARGLALRRERPDLLGFFALRALGVALAVMVVAAAVSYPLAGKASTTADEEDPVADLVAQL